MRTSEQTGFSLIEVLVALAVLSVSAIALLTATQNFASNAEAITARSLARWSAENHLTRLRLGLEKLSNGRTQTMMGGEKFEILREVSTTSNPQVFRVKIEVERYGEQDKFFTLTGFVEQESDH